jgi:hypothetical protein
MATNPSSKLRPQLAAILFSVAVVLSVLASLASANPGGFLAASLNTTYSTDFPAYLTCQRLTPATTVVLIGGNRLGSGSFSYACDTNQPGAYSHFVRLTQLTGPALAAGSRVRFSCNTGTADVDATLFGTDVPVGGSFTISGGHSGSCGLAFEWDVGEAAGTRDIGLVSTICTSP